MESTALNARLDKIETKMDEIAKTISTIAVQQAKIDRIEARVRDVEVRHEHLVSPEGVLSEMRSFQASCPRRQVAWVWIVLIPMGLTLLGMGFLFIQR